MTRQIFADTVHKVLHLFELGLTADLEYDSAGFDRSHVEGDAALAFSRFLTGALWEGERRD